MSAVCSWCDRPAPWRLRAEGGVAAVSSCDEHLLRALRDMLYYPGSRVVAHGPFMISAVNE